MVEIKEKELKDVSGGGLTWGAGCVIIGAVVFIIGVIDGYTRPLRCR